MNDDHDIDLDTAPPDPEVDRFECPEADRLDDTIAATISELNRLRDEVARHRPWLFVPGDKVLVLLEETVYSGVVQQVQMPSPMGEQFPDHIVRVLLDEGSVFAGHSPWCNPDQVELIHA